MSEHTVKSIIIEYLREHGFDGLWSADGECGCRLGDLWPCEGDVSCRPGYESPCDCGHGEHDFHIGLATSPQTAPPEEVTGQ